MIKHSFTAKALIAKNHYKYNKIYLGKNKYLHYILIILINSNYFSGWVQFKSASTLPNMD